MPNHSPILTIMTMTLTSFLTQLSLSASPTYLQEIRVNPKVFKIFEGKSITSILESPQGSIFVGTTSGLYVQKVGEDDWQQLNEDPILDLDRTNDGSVYAISSDTVYHLSLDSNWKMAVLCEEMKPLSAIAAGNDGTILLLRKKGEKNNLSLHASNGSSSELPKGAEDIYAISLVASSTEGYYIGSKQGLWHLSKGHLQFIRHPIDSEGFPELLLTGEQMHDLLVTPEGKVIWGNDLGLASYDPTTGKWESWRPDKGHFPFLNPTSLSLDNNGRIWAGSRFGATRQLDSDHWRFYQGERWLVEDSITTLECTHSGRTYLGTKSGLSAIDLVPMTLADKAAYYHEIMKSRHISRYGVCWEAPLRIRGDVESFAECGFTDNDCLWTMPQLFAECLRFAVTKDPEARALARRFMDGIEMLETVTGIPGYPARAWLDTRYDYREEWNTTPDGRYQWNGDTSSDEAVGHYFCHWAYYTFVATPEEKERQKELIGAMTDHILRNGFHYVEREDGEPTRWGVWSPERTWEWGHYWYSSGLYSLCLLSHLAVAEEITGNPRYGNVASELIEKHNYLRATLRQKITIPHQFNHSDDQMAFFTFYPLILLEKDPARLEVYRKALEISWESEGKENVPVYVFMVQALLGRNEGVDAAIRHLQEYPWDLVEWSHDNTHRRDILLDPMTAGNPQSQTGFSPAEYGPYSLVQNLLALKSGNDGMTERPGSTYLCAYWLGRYHGFIGDKD